MPAETLRVSSIEDDDTFEKILKRLMNSPKTSSSGSVPKNDAGLFNDHIFVLDNYFHSKTKEMNEEFKEAVMQFMSNSSYYVLRTFIENFPWPSSFIYLKKEQSENLFEWLIKYYCEKAKWIIGFLTLVWFPTFEQLPKQSLATGLNVVDLMGPLHYAPMFVSFDSLTEEGKIVRFSIDPIPAFCIRGNGYENIGDGGAKGDRGGNERDIQDHDSEIRKSDNNDNHIGDNSTGAIYGCQKHFECGGDDDDDDNDDDDEHFMSLSHPLYHVYY
ncbi:unnamed protein product [Ambrosiozyma monospora]|uniref:Unnamed protein product n=1 Tax=Ambrosiozyma monospora TaxID=43982 RepID=A0ACB5SRL3_AMBMO|nr:unnamed protein product [Ambrosiozyma monospora]